MTRILVTNNGPHSSEQWAVATSEIVFSIDPAVVDDRLLSAKRLQMKIAEALMVHYEKIHNAEQENLKSNPEYILKPHNVSEYLDDVMSDITAAAKDSPWKDHFAKSEVQNAARTVIENHLQTAQHVDRMWHADRNPDSEHAKIYKNQFGQ